MDMVSHYSVYTDRNAVNHLNIFVKNIVLAWDQLCIEKMILKFAVIKQTLSRNTGSVSVTVFTGLIIYLLFSNE